MVRPALADRSGDGPNPTSRLPAGFAAFPPGEGSPRSPLEPTTIDIGGNGSRGVAARMTGGVAPRRVPQAESHLNGPDWTPGPFGFFHGFSKKGTGRPNTALGPPGPDAAGGPANVRTTIRVGPDERSERLVREFECRTTSRF